MPGLVNTMMEPPPIPIPADEAPALGFVVSHQVLDLEVNFATKSISGRTEITILPLSQSLKQIRINARQCEILRQPGILPVTVNGRLATFKHDDPYEKMKIRDYVEWDVEQWELQKDRIDSIAKGKSATGELVIDIPKPVKIEEVNPFSEIAPSAIRERAVAAVVTSGVRNVSGVIGLADTPPLATPRNADDGSGLRFSPIKVVMHFTSQRFRDGLHFEGMGTGNHRFPHVYTRHTTYPGSASCIFPCVDESNMRCTWEIAIKCGKTLADVLQSPMPQQVKSRRDEFMQPRLQTGREPFEPLWKEPLTLPPEDRALEMVIVCSADNVDEVVDPADPSKKIATFISANQVAPQHIGFAIGPFEQVDVSEYREHDEDDKLGQKAVQVTGYCLPKRSEELRFTCEPLAAAIDWFSLTFGSYPFSDFKLCFVESQVSDTVPTASLVLCSTRLLVSPEIIDPVVDNTRKLVHSLASQWIGVNIMANLAQDEWVIVGVSYFIADLFMQHLCGRNEYRFNQKQRSDYLVKVDVDRPPLIALGEALHLGSFETDFMILKAPLVLFILDRRLMKSSGSTALTRVIAKMVTTANTSEQLQDKTVSTETFRRLCEKIGHYKLDTFFNQWVMGSGCPRFHITQRFNKKKLTVEMTIVQKQEAMSLPRKMDKTDFVREYKEDLAHIWAGEIQPFFTGPMTIRIHEADGTPYEHIVEIREAIQKIEIPYHTKYKRLKRSRREKERAYVGIGFDGNAEIQDDSLLYCLGDILQTRNEVLEWKLSDWGPDVLAAMDQESYEWIRMDADFEWLCQLSINMPSYMYVSQLQQDRDVVAQQDSMLFLNNQPPHPLISTFLIRTLMDRRYFHGIRTMAAQSLAHQGSFQANDDLHNSFNAIGQFHLEKAFQEFFCYPDSSMPRSNDFTDRTAYLIKCAIPKAMSDIRDKNGKCPKAARDFILEQLRLNDNGNNEFADFHYVSQLMLALTNSLIPSKKSKPEQILFDVDMDDDDLQSFTEQALEQIDRYRRMDEWTLSYQCLYTVSALHCMQRLMKENVITPNFVEFTQYCHDGALDLVRIKALEALTELGLFIKNPLFSELLMTTLTTDSSPFVREKVFKILGVGLAAIAFGEHQTREREVETTQKAPDQDGGLIIEQVDVNMDAKRAQNIRATSIDGAIAGLKEELQDTLWLREMLWNCVKSHVTGAMEQASFLELCSFLYHAQDRMKVKLQLPRYLKATRVAKSIIKFERTNKIRTKILDPMPAIAPPTGATPKKFVLKRVLTQESSPAILDSITAAPKTLKRASPQARHSEEPQSKIIKLKVRLPLPQGSDSQEPGPKSPPPVVAPLASPTYGVTLGSTTQPRPRVPLPNIPIPLNIPASQRTPLPSERKPLPTERKPLPSAVPPSPPPPALVKKPSFTLKLTIKKET